MTTKETTHAKAVSSTDLLGILGENHKIGLTAKKTESVLSRDGYQISGFVLTSPEGRTAIVDHACVRWLSKEEMWWLMHDSAQWDQPPINKPHPLMDCPDCGEFLGHGHVCKPNALVSNGCAERKP